MENATDVTDSHGHRSAQARVKQSLEGPNTWVQSNIANLRITSASAFGRMIGEQLLLLPSPLLLLLLLLLVQLLVLVLLWLLVWLWFRL
ncbi:hypothetical protein FVE85_5164 [Porphyridium purpureum]|uniref:Uncharacterized protein n=1 Tax=Porphyridium purpureum TaxID=35688 RepID=A0A5J4Z114_PORPP|nr:hypothetical protein FVE85_5164 [Porphyridium purpureum]|eukprot:POR7558..scf295_1